MVSKSLYNAEKDRGSYARRASDLIDRILEQETPGSTIDPTPTLTQEHSRAIDSPAVRDGKGLDAGLGLCYYLGHTARDCFHIWGLFCLHFSLFLLLFLLYCYFPSLLPE